MNKISSVNVKKIKQISKKIAKPLLTTGLITSCSLMAQSQKDSFIKEKKEAITPFEIKSILEKRGFNKKEVEKVLEFQAKGDKEKLIVEDLLELKQSYKKSFPVLSFIKIKKSKNFVQSSEFMKIIEQVSKKCSDIDFVLELINLKKEEKAKQKTFWEDGGQLLQYIKGAENSKIKEMMQKYMYTNIGEFAKLENFCWADLSVEAMEKYEYLQKNGVAIPPKYFHAIRYRKGKTDSEEFIKKFKIIQSLTKTLDKEIYFSSANNSFSSESWERIVKACREKNEKNEEILETLTKLLVKDIDLWEELYKNPSFKNVKIYHIINSVTDKNRNFILDLSKQEDFPKEILAGVACRSTYSCDDLLKALCVEETIDKKQILKYYDQLNAIPSVNYAQLDIAEAFKILNILKDYDEKFKAFAKKNNVNIDMIITRINNYLGIEKPILKVEKQQQVEFFKNIITNNNPEVERVLKTFDFRQFGKKGLPIKYSRKDFNKKIDELLKELNREEQRNICTHFGLQRGVLGGFNGLFNNTDYENTSATVKELEISKKIQEEINKFTLENEILIEDKIVKKVLDGLLKGLPEFATLVGKEQHQTHDYSVDIHSLLVLQRAMNNPLYQKLNNSDKTVLKISALLHDIGKREGVIDEGHAKISSGYTRSILERMSFPEKIKHKIIATVDSHHWFARFCKKINVDNSVNIAAREVFVNAHSPNDLNIFEILAKADFQSVSSTFHLLHSKTSSEEKFDKYIQEKMDLLEKSASENLYKYSNFIKTTKFTTKLFPEEKVKIDGKKTVLRVLNFKKISSDEDMRKYGFGCKNKEDLRFLVHMTYHDRESLESMRKITGNPLMHKMWSTSLIKLGHDVTYMQREYGGIFEADNSNILMAYNTNMSSGSRKNEENYKFLLISNLRNDLENRSFLKEALLNELLKKGFRLSEEDYIDLSRHILSFDDLKLVEAFKTKNITISAKIIIDAIEKAQEKLFLKNTQNEIVGIDLRLKALVAKVKKIEDCEPEFLRLARDYNLGIILI